MLKFLLEPVFWILAVVLIAVLTWFVVVAGRRRRMLGGLAVRCHMRFTQRDTLRWMHRFGPAYCMQSGHAGQIYNIISGRRKGHQVLFFDYRYETGSGQDRGVHLGSAVACCANTELPSVVALRDNVFERWGRFGTFVTTRLEDDPFDRCFSLFTDQPESVRRLLEPELARLFTRCYEVNWEFCGRYVLFFTDQLQAPGRIARLINRAVQCCQLICARGFN